MKPDIKTRGDLELLLAEFYKSAIADAEIGHHFADLDLETHLPIIVSFWEKVLFGTPVYFGSPFDAHLKINENSPIRLEHFRRWIEIFGKTIDKFFAGATAENAKLRAKMIAHSLYQGINRAA